MKGEAFIKMPRDLVRSAAWKSLGINARRFLDFLMGEHMDHGGRENGFLLAPRRQLEGSGIGARHVSAAIEEAERFGFVDIKRGVGRRPSTYALTWLPLHDGTLPERRWLIADAEMTSEGKSLLMTSEGKHQVLPKGSHKGRSDFRREVIKGQNRGIRREAPSKISYQGSSDSMDGTTLAGPDEPDVPFDDFGVASS
jgi:hypothetical protein